MKRPHGNRVWRGMVLAAAIGAVAVLAVSGLAMARGHDGDRHRHGADTGTISAFDANTGVLAIELSGGGDTVTGLVNRRTKIRCEDERSPDVSVRARENEPGDDHGGHGNEAGDDNGGRGGESGDDNGGRGPSGHDDNGSGANCTVSDLVVGATVHEAELDLRDGNAVWDEVELND